MRTGFTVTVGLAFALIWSTAGLVAGCDGLTEDGPATTQSALLMLDERPEIAAIDTCVLEIDTCMATVPAALQTAHWERHLLVELLAEADLPPEPMPPSAVLSIVYDPQEITLEGMPSILPVTAGTHVIYEVIARGYCPSGDCAPLLELTLERVDGSGPFVVSVTVEDAE